MKISKTQIERAKNNKLIILVTKMCLTSATLALNEEFGFGADRLNRFAAKFTEILNEHSNRYDDVALEALIKHAKENGIDVGYD